MTQNTGASLKLPTGANRTLEYIINANAAIQVPVATGASVIRTLLILNQDSVGGWVPSFTADNGTTIEWVGGVSPSAATTATRISERTIYSFTSLNGTLIGSIDEMPGIVKTSVTGSSKTLSASDSGVAQWCNSATTQTLTIPEDVEFTAPIQVVQLGAGIVYIVGASGVTINGRLEAGANESRVSLPDQYSAAVIYPSGTANEYYALGVV